MLFSYLKRKLTKKQNNDKDVKNSIQNEYQRIHNKFLPISKPILEKISHKRNYSTIKTIKIMKELINDLKNTKESNRTQIVKCFYIAKYSVLHTNYPERLESPVEINDGNDGIFNSFNSAGRKMILPTFLGGSKEKYIRAKQYNKIHKNNPETISANALIDNLNDVIDNIKYKISESIKYYLSQQVITTQSDDEKLGLKPGSYKPIKFVSKNFNEQQEPLNYKVNELKEKAVEIGGNSVINIHIKWDKHPDEILGASGTIYADIIKIKNRNIIPKGYSHPFSNVKLLKKLENNVKSREDALN